MSAQKGKLVDLAEQRFGLSHDAAVAWAATVHADTRTEQFVALAEQQFGISHDAAVARIAEMQRADELADAAWLKAHPNWLQEGPTITTFEATMKNAAGTASPAQIAQLKRLCEKLDDDTLSTAEFKELIDLQNLVLLPPTQLLEYQRRRAEIDANVAATVGQVNAYLDAHPRLREKEEAMIARSPLSTTYKAPPEPSAGSGWLLLLLLLGAVLALFVGWWVHRFAYRHEIMWRTRALTTDEAMNTAARRAVRIGGLVGVAAALLALWVLVGILLIVRALW